MADINTLWNTLTNWSFKDLIKASRLNAGQDNIKQLKDYIRGDNGEGTGVDGHTHNGTNSLAIIGQIQESGTYNNPTNDPVATGTITKSYTGTINFTTVFINAPKVFVVLKKVSLLGGGAAKTYAGFDISVNTITTTSFNYSFNFDFAGGSSDNLNISVEWFAVVQ